MMITMSIERHSNVCPSFFDGMDKLLDENMLRRDDVLKITPVKNGDCVGNDDVEGGEGEATASSHLCSMEGRQARRQLLRKMGVLESRHCVSYNIQSTRGD